MIREQRWVSARICNSDTKLIDERSCIISEVVRSVVGCDLTFASMVWKWVQQVVILAGSQIKRVVKYACWRVKQVVLLDECAF